MTIAYLNGKFLPINKAHVPAMDRGFLFGDAVYEVFPVFGGKVFRLKQHIERLKRSLSSIRLEIDIDDYINRDTLQKLIDKNGNGNQVIYLQITRGAYEVRQLAIPADPKPTVFAYAIPLKTRSIDDLAKGVTAVTLSDIRWQFCHTKATTLLANVLMHQQALDKGVDEAILVNKGFAIEGTSSNLFAVIDGTIITPPLSPELLGGITRELVLELAAHHNLAHEQRNILEGELSNAEEIWLTGSGKEIVPVIKLNDKQVGSGKAGTVWQQMINYYQDYKALVSKH